MRLALLALFLPAICLAQSAGQPRLSLDPRSYDFGRIAPAQPVTHAFKASNSGSAPLTITKVNPSCGCTSSVVGQRTLAPGESTLLEVTFNPAGYRGMARKSVQVLSNDPLEPDQAITFDVEVLPAVLPSTEQVLFTDLVPKDRRKASVKLETENGQPILVTHADLSPAPWLGVVTRPEGKDQWVDFDLLAHRLPANKLSGLDTVILHVSNPEPSDIKLTVRWERRAPVVATPDKVAWAETAGQDLRAALVLKDRQNHPFRILSARTSNPLLTVTGIRPGAAVTQQVQVLLSAKAKPGVYDERAFLTLDTPGHPEFEIRVAASLR